MKRLLHAFLMGRTKGSNLERMCVFFFSSLFGSRYLWFCGVNEIKREKITLLFFFIHFVILYFKITMSGVQNVITYNNQYCHER